MDEADFHPSFRFRILCKRIIIRRVRGLVSVLLVLAVVLDGFTACFAYGVNRIKIPLLSAVLISLMGTGMLMLSLGAADWVGGSIPPHVCKVLSFSVLFLIGLCTLFQNSVKAILQKASDNSKKMSFRWSGISFMLSVCLDETKADADCSKVLSAKEALALGAALSIDSLATGFGSGLIGQNYLLILALALTMHMTAILLGHFLGEKVSKGAGAKHLQLEWLGGVILMVLAFIRLLG